MAAGALRGDHGHAAPATHPDLEVALRAEPPAEPPEHGVDVGISPRRAELLEAPAAVAREELQVLVGREPAEDVQLSIRRAPRAVRLEWTAGSHKGRGAIYSASEPAALLHVSREIVEPVVGKSPKRSSWMCAGR